MTGGKPRGRFVWFDLITTDPIATRAFYPPVTGWATSQWDGPTKYTMWTSRGAALGGVMSNGGATPYWLAYISSPNVDETVKLAEDLGARVETPASTVPTVGRFAVLFDPQGARFAVFTPEGEAPGHEGIARVGEFSWHELATHDYPAAYRFYERLFGWERASAVDMGGGEIYQMFGRNGIVLGGTFNKKRDDRGPAWLHYVLVEHLDRALEAVKTHGGQVITGPMEVPGGGDTIARCVDPQGAPFALHERRA